MFAALMNFMRANNILPRISDTERQALEAGTVWVDGQIFSGNPDFRKMLAEPYNTLSPEEQAFLDGPAEELCQMVDPYELERTRKVPEKVLNYIKKQGFMGLLIPKEYGGKAFSTLAISSIMAKVNTWSTPMGTFVVIPNSLGAAELLKHYGTDKQKKEYLPRLASGEYVPCFGLTELTAGSDAASLKAEGEVFKQGKSVKIRLNFAKRYITLAPAANLISLAVRLHDPDNLLGKGEQPGITVLMLNKGTKGLEIGNHHVPIGAGFYNGPIVGKDVIASPEQIIGGPDYAGQGWRMLMEQLAGGRAVSLPAGAIGSMKSTAAVTGPYSMVRKQFGFSIGAMEGIQDKVAGIAGLTYMFEGARVYSCSAIDNGEQPPVISAILKASSTEHAQRLAVDGMDVFSGAGVMQGPNNILASGYSSAPVGITVEGANIMTRTLIIFGQGATRCHPYALPLVRAVEDENVDAFRANLLGWLGHTATNWGRTWARTLTRGFTAGSPVSGPTASYYRRLGWAASRFALLTDLAMYLIGGKLKARGNLTGRFADALTWQFMALSALRRFEAEGRPREDLPLVEYACEYALARIQEAFEGIHANFDAPVVGWWLRWPSALILRLNPLSRGPRDRLIPAVAATIQRDSEQYRRLTAGQALAGEDSPGAGRLLKAWRLQQEVEPVIRKLVKAQKAGDLARGEPHEVTDTAKKQKLISATEAKLVKDARAAAMTAIEVDVFSPEAYFGDLAKPLKPAGNGTTASAGAGAGAGKAATSTTTRKRSTTRKKTTSTKTGAKKAATSKKTTNG